MDNWYDAVSSWARRVAGVRGSLWFRVCFRDIGCSYDSVGDQASVDERALVPTSTARHRFSRS